MLGKEGRQDKINKRAVITEEKRIKLIKFVKPVSVLCWSFPGFVNIQNSLDVVINFVNEGGVKIV